MILFDTGIYKLTHKESGKVYIGQSKHSDETKQKMRDAHMKRKELKLQQELA